MTVQQFDRLLEVSDRNATRASSRDSGEVLPTHPTELIHPSIKPRAGEPVITKHRTSAFSGSAFEMILRAKNIPTINTLLRQSEVKEAQWNQERLTLEEILVRIDSAVISHWYAPGICFATGQKIWPLFDTLAAGKLGRI